MKLKFGAIVVDGRGKIGGHVMSKNRAGAYMRTKVSPVNPRTTDQAACRSRLSAISSAWRGLTTGYVPAWNAAVDAWKKTDIFGDLKKPSGFNLHQRLNNNALRCGGSAITLPPAPVAISSLGSLALTAVGPATFEVTCGLLTLGTNEVLEISATPGMSKGISFVKSEYRIIISDAALTAGVYDATADYNAKFGAPGTTDGKLYFIEAKIVNTVTGQAGVPRTASMLNV
jgi:hypothetical protein